MKIKLLIIFLLGYSSLLIGQESEQLKKITQSIEGIDIANWNAEAFESYEKEIIALEKKCEKFDCGEIPIQLMLYRASDEIEQGKSNILYQKLLPILSTEKIETPMTKAFANELVGLYYILNGQLDSSIYYLTRAEKILKTTAPNNKRMGATKAYIGFYYSFQNVHDTSVIYMKKSVDIHQNNGDTLAAIKANKYLSSFYNLMGNTEESIETLLETKKMVTGFEPAKSFMNRIDAGLANAYLSLKDYEKTEQTAQKAIRRIENSGNITPNVTDLWDFYLIIGEVKLATNQANEAIISIQKAREICEKYDLPKIHLISTIAFEAEAQINLNELDDAEKTTVELFDKIRKTKTSESYLMKVANLIYQLFSKKHQFNSNIIRDFQPRMTSLTNNAMGENENTDGLIILKLQTIYDILNNDKNAALSHFQRAFEINDSIEIRNRNTALEESLIRQENLEQIQELVQKEVKLKDRTIQRNGLIAGLLFVLFIVSGLLFRSREKQKMTNELEQKVEQRTKELKIVNEQLLQSNTELERFNYITSHDLKEPLRNILGYISLINNKQLVEDTELKTYFKHVTYNADQMNLLLNNMIQYSNIINKEVELETVEISELMLKIMEEEEAFIVSKNAQVVFSNSPEVKTDKEAIYLVLKNLINNGLKFNESEKPIVNITHQINENFHWFSIEDNGIGILEDYHEQVFELFKRLHHRGKYIGSGVGLSMTKRIIEQLGGEINLKSSKNEGTIISFSIPISS